LGSPFGAAFDMECTMNKKAYYYLDKDTRIELKNGARILTFYCGKKGQIREVDSLPKIDRAYTKEAEYVPDGRIKDNREIIEKIEEERVENNPIKTQIFRNSKYKRNY